MIAGVLVQRAVRWVSRRFVALRNNGRSGSFSPVQRLLSGTTLWSPPGARGVQSPDPSARVGRSQFLRATSEFPFGLRTLYDRTFLRTQ